ncbi:MAG: hypothetical protein GXY36_17715 [Chloroflexi bacterium]|nr:hypothetical protein [Chloroflexota bacterium]
MLTALQLLNETLTATIVIVSASILLYNLSQHTGDRVTRASSIVLFCVTLTYVGDVLVSLDPGGTYLEAWLRFQWIGIALLPAALFHLSDALLATTGRPSRGRRTFVIRLSYLISLVLMVLALYTDTVVHGPEGGEVPRMKPGPAFAIYAAYLIVLALVSIINVVRARRRCLTRYTRRRMTYLLAVFLSPVYGVFPYSLLFNPLGDTNTPLLLVILNLANLIIMLMLVFMAYPLSFFGSEKPDRVVKSQLLEFMLRGPLTGAIILATVLFVPRITNFLGIDGDALMPFAVVTILLILQWSITLLLPVLRRWLIYGSDQPYATWLQGLSDRLLTQADGAQLLESILAAICDRLRVPTAFVARLQPDGAELVQVVGSLVPSPEALTAPELAAFAESALPEQPLPESLRKAGDLFLWHSYWLVPLRSHHPTNGAEAPLQGILGVWTRAPEPDLDEEEQAIFRTLTQQAAQVLEDLQRQSEVFLLLEGLASQMDVVQQWRSVSRYGRVQTPPPPSSDLIAHPDFSDVVKDALRDYWGGPRLTESELLRLNVVWQEMEHADDQNPVNALRTVLAQAIENLKPEGQRSLTTTEWILYNILEMRFLQGRKVRDVALRLAMSESDLYRKQRVAIEEVARQIADMERTALSKQTRSSKPGES